jgi:oligopeptide transport system ATP-binding protein
MSRTDQPLVSVRELRKWFTHKKKTRSGAASWLKAVDGVSFDIHRGETFALVGESGSGKTTLAQVLIGLVQPTGGQIEFDGAVVETRRRSSYRSLRRRMQIVFQDPYSSLDPKMNAGQIIGEALPRTVVRQKERADRIARAIDMVGLPRTYTSLYPHQLSGGQRQRAAIARALVVEPEFLIFDEPASALDVSVQAQILNLLVELQRRLGLTYLFISHDLAVVRHMATRVGVMYLGRIVEEGSSDELFVNPVHPYTQALLSAVPQTGTGQSLRKRRIMLQGEIPSPIDPPHSCNFASRCFRSIDACGAIDPDLLPLNPALPDHTVACINWAPIVDAVRSRE